MTPFLEDESWKPLWKRALYTRKMKDLWIQVFLVRCHNVCSLGVVFYKKNCHSEEPMLNFGRFDSVIINSCPLLLSYLCEAVTSNHNKPCKAKRLYLTINDIILFVESALIENQSLLSFFSLRSFPSWIYFIRFSRYSACTNVPLPLFRFDDWMMINCFLNPELWI